MTPPPSLSFRKVFGLAKMKVKARNYTGKPKLADYKPMLNDIIIPIMGPSGVGKSTFINYLAGEDVVRVGHGAQSCTTDLQPIVVDPPPSILFRGRRLVLVDTPGFDETFAADSDILKRISSWLAHAYSADTKLGGLIYLHDISLTRIKGTALRNLEVFKKLCGDRALRSVVLGTTRWTQLASPSVGEGRVKQLCDVYWKEMIKQGSMVHNFEDTQKSAWEMVDSVLAYDVIIPVIGVTGVGKSLFVNTLAGRREVVVGEELHSCTSEVQPVIIDPMLASSRKASYHGRRLIVVDTPGFDATFVDDSTTLKHIVDNLTTRYGSDIKLGGIIHLHDVNLRPHTDFDKYLDAIGQLCAEPRALILGTTKWGDDTRRSERERKLSNLTGDYWKKLIAEGAKVCKFTGTQDSAWMMVKAILDDNIDIPHRTEVLQIQDELVRAKKLLPDTEAGRQLRYSLYQLLKTLNTSLSSEELNPVQIASIRAQIKALHIPLSQRVFRFFDVGVDKMLGGFSQKNHLRELLTSQAGTKAEVDCVGAILLLGESQEGKHKLLELLFAEEERNLPTPEFKLWSVKHGDGRLVLIDTPDFELFADALKIFQKIRSWLETSCFRNTRFGVLCLRDEVVRDKVTDFDTDASCPNPDEPVVEEPKALSEHADPAGSSNHIIPATSSGSSATHPAISPAFDGEPAVRAPPLRSLDAAHQGPMVGLPGAAELLRKSPLVKTTFFVTPTTETDSSKIDGPNPNGSLYAFDGEFATFLKTSLDASRIVDGVLDQTIPFSALLEALPGKADKLAKDKSLSRNPLRRFFPQESL